MAAGDFPAVLTSLPAASFETTSSASGRMCVPRQIDAAPGRLRNLPRASPCVEIRFWWQGLTPLVASLFAARFRVAEQHNSTRKPAQPTPETKPAYTEKRLPGAVVERQSSSSNTRSMGRARTARSSRVTIGR